MNNTFSFLKEIDTTAIALFLVLFLGAGSHFLKSRLKPRHLKGMQFGFLAAITAVVFGSLEEQGSQTSFYDWFWDLGGITPAYFSYKIQPQIFAACFWVAFFVMGIFQEKTLFLLSVLGVFLSWLSDGVWSTLFSHVIVVATAVIFLVKQSPGRLNFYLLKRLLLVFVFLFVAIAFSKQGLEKVGQEAADPWVARICFLGVFLSTAWFFRQELAPLLKSNKAGETQATSSFLVYVMPAMSTLAFLKNVGFRIEEPQEHLLIHGLVLGLLLVVAFFAFFLKEALKTIGYRVLVLPVTTLAAAIFLNPSVAVYYFILQSVLLGIAAKKTDSESNLMSGVCVLRTVAVFSVLVDVLFTFHFLSNAGTTFEIGLLNQVTAFVFLLLSVVTNSLVLFSVKVGGQNEETKDKLINGAWVASFSCLFFLIVFLDAIVSKDAFISNEGALFELKHPEYEDWRFFVPISVSAVGAVLIALIYRKSNSTWQSLSEKLPATDRLIQQESFVFGFWNFILDFIRRKLVPISDRIRAATHEMKTLLLQAKFELIQSISLAVNNKKVVPDAEERAILPLSKLIQVTQNGNIKWYLVFSFFWTVILLLNYLRF